MTERFDLVVIGAGPAGEKAGAQAAYFGKRVAIVDRRSDPGGSAASKTGVPTKTLREAALYLTGFRRRDLYGLGMDLTRDTVLERMRTRTAEVVQLAVEAVRRNLERHGIEFVVGEARLGPDRTVLVATEAGERMLRGDVVLVATGSRPYHPPDLFPNDPDVHDSESILELERIPSRLVVIGGGPVGCEYASIFLALGSDVTLVDRGSRLLPFADAELSEALATIFERRGMRLIRQADASGLERVDGALRLSLEDGRTQPTDAVLFAAGRAGSTDGLQLDAAGVKTDERGRILVDDTYRTSAEGIYAAGDVIGPPGLASAAMEQGRVAACHAFAIPFKDTVDPLAPFGVYSVPELGMVGLTEEAAREQGIDVGSGRSPFEANARARIAGAAEGLVKLVFTRQERRLLGVHILGDDASELIHIGQAVLHAGGTIDYFIHSTFNVPTLSEAYKYAAYDGLQRLSGHRL
ncbi:MAG TPA: Si-specific NAD(P)(+) transhydrogenase [Actinomycetota bacterium]|nr:Si-specific NAD(P)(+) transhydrogenase [Actinomycetota bacterium]